MSALKKFLYSFWQGCQELLQSILKPVSRIFSPTDDQYPATGVQPFEGEPFDERRGRHEY